MTHDRFAGRPRCHGSSRLPAHVVEPPSTPVVPLDTYADLVVQLSQYPKAASTILKRHGLTEAVWEQISELWEARLSEALDEEQPDGSPAPFAVSYAEAIQHAQERHVRAPLQLDLFCSLLAAMRAGKPLAQVLHQRDISVSQFFAAQTHWMRQASVDPALFERLMGHDRTRSHFMTRALEKPPTHKK